MTTTNKTTLQQSILPSWYTNYTQDILSNQQAVANRPYTPYNSARVAGFTPTQQQGFDMTQNAATSYQPALGAAQAGTIDSFGRSTQAAAAPYTAAAADASGLNPAYGALAHANNLSNASTQPTGISLASPYLGQAAGLAGASTQNLGLQAANPYLQQAASMSGAGAAQPAMQQSANYTMASGNDLGMQAASPYLQQAGQSSVSNIGDYMNPYTDQVVNRIGQLGARTLSEQLMPAINAKFIGGGQFNSSRNAEMLGRSLRDVSESTSAQQSQALQQGYSEAAQLAAADRARSGQLASTAGQLGQAQQQSLATAGSQLGQLGNQYGQLTQQDQQGLTNIGSQYGQLGTQQQQALANAGNQFAQIGSQYGQLGQAQQGALAAAAGQQGQFASQYAGMAQNQQQLLSQLGSQVASQYGQDTANQLAASGQLAQFAAQRQQQGLAGASAVTGVGAQQQGLDQRNLDQAYQDFLAQQQYPQTQIDQMAKTMGAVSTGVPTGQLQYENQKLPNTSTLSQLAGIGLTAAGSGLFGQGAGALPAAPPKG
jgi:hypothetical protein